MEGLKIKLPLEEKATREALYQIYKTSKFSIGGHFVTLLIVIFVLSEKVSFNIIVSGFILLTMILLGRTYALFQYKKNIPAITDAGKINYWLRLFKIGAFMTGLAWGITLFFLSDLPAEYHFFIYVIIVGLAASGIVTLGMIFSLYLVYMLPMLGMCLIWMLLQDGILYSTSALLTAILIFYYYYSVGRFSHNFNQAFIEKEAVRNKQQYLQSIIDGIYDPIMVIKEDYTVELMNSALYKTTKNNNFSDPMSPKCYEISHNRSTPCHGSKHPCPLSQVINSKKHSVIVHNHCQPEGEKNYIELSASPLFDNEQHCVGIIESSRNITAHIQAQDELRIQKNILHYQAHHDALTGLPNRILFNDRLEQGIEKSKRNNTKMALLFIDLDHFKEINDSLGHKAGDVILKVVTQRLKKTIRQEDTLARFGGDEFIIIMEELSQGQNATRLAQRIIDYFILPITVENNLLYVSSSIGISLYPDDGSSAQNLLKYADAAMYKAKNDGRNNFQFYSAEMTELAFERVIMETHLRTALKSKEFVVYYQPQINAENNKLIGMEALVRWQHPTMGLLSPAKFIPLAELTGLIIKLDQLVMKIAMMQISQWYRKGLNPGRLSLNLAIKQLHQNDFITILEKLIKKTRCKPKWLELEVTEGQIMSNPEEAIKTLNQISDLGINLAIDDFGTGYSSLSYLKKLPINKLKIDQSFVRELPNDEEDAAIAKAVIALAQSLNLSIIAEGVETKEQKEFLVNNGCENIQGYFYSRPIPADEMEKYLKTQIIK